MTRPAGRKPRPTAVKIAKGTERNDRKNYGEPTVEIGAPDCPDHLCEIAHMEWDRMVDILLPMGVMSPAFACALELYCDSYAKWREATAMVNRLGQAVVKKDKDGQVIVCRNQYSVEAHKYKDECVRLLAEFGLTPSAKTRIDMKTQDKKRIVKPLDRMA